MDKLTELLTVLAEKLGTTSEYLFSVLIKQSQVVFFHDIIWIFILMLLIIAYFIYTQYCYKNWKRLYDNDLEFGNAVALLLGGITVIVLIVALGRVINEMITIQMNPDFWALDYIMQMLN